jgi:hypothetical protein
MSFVSEERRGKSEGKKAEGEESRKGEGQESLKCLKSLHPSHTGAFPFHPSYPILGKLFHQL